MGHLTRLGQTNVGAAVGRLVVVVTTMPIGIQRDGVTAHDVKSQRLGVQCRTRGDHDGGIDLTRMGGQPFDHLNAAEAAAHEARQMRDAQLTQERAVELNGVANGETGKCRTIGLARGRIDGRRTRRALAAAQHIGADHTIAIRVNGTAGAHNAIPPARGLRLARTPPRDMGIAREGMTNEDDIVVFGLFKSARLPRHLNMREGAAVLQTEAPIGKIQRQDLRRNDAN